jgi:hypothetical protein
MKLEPQDRTTQYTHIYSTTPYRARRDSLEVAWELHIHICKRKHSPSLLCTKCQSPLTNTHILGGCRLTAKLIIKRHNIIFRLILQLLQKSNGGRWPILCADLGHKPVADFSSLAAGIDTSTHTHTPPRNHVFDLRGPTRREIRKTGLPAIHTRLRPTPAT